MPGEIVSVPFSSQIEDVDKYLLDYRNLKSVPQHNSSSSDGANSFDNQFQTRYGSNNYINKRVDMFSEGNAYYNRVGNRGYLNSNSNNYNRKKNMNRSYNSRTETLNQEHFDQNNHESPQQDLVGLNFYSQNPAVAAHLKQTYPQLFQNINIKSSNSVSSIDIKRDNTLESIYGISNHQIYSNARDYKKPPVFNSQSSMNATQAMPFNQNNLDFLMSNDTSFANSTAGFKYDFKSNIGSLNSSGIFNSPFQPYLNSNMLSSVSTTSTDTISSAVSPNLLNDVSNIQMPVHSTGSTASLDFKDHTDNSINKNNNMSITQVSSKHNGEVPSLDCGSNNDNSSTTNGRRPFGIWNNDMSVWS
ncbi:hypothetical protein KAFR_0L01830 [Kazachstania africana CBS 2517]|uniref:Uncharacterized protein n=1 Tax=Kazachstania africana (strain ATCC 22294 / BCRC 22015 / CBS 2517 / CECT 1963 / NBRC 1671 / NRRL Y-8276) TaxID=1071382 RepID=H2B2E3_KAZAF|nr:hypothetical protein KAFR_0L01830 [Kazachstania africana CBS 2517]CCF60793.1 hypothetical protein KAFR_0L01830 [Kazachstania africana CBS 2517]